MVVENPEMKGHHKRPGKERLSIMLIGNSWGLVSWVALMFSHEMLIGIGSFGYMCLSLNRFSIKDS